MLRNIYIRTIILLFATAMLWAGALSAQVIPQTGHREVRAVWLTTLGGLDWPKGYARNASGVERQKEQLCRHLDNLQRMGINLVLFQTRTRGMVVYPSKYEPWEGALSGRPGVSPGYDALQFAVEECHRRGMAVQAWVVAYPLANFTVTRQLGKQSVVSKHPGMCIKTGDHWMMNPAVPAVGDYLADLCREIVENYDVDGIHLDYVRYPEKEIPFDDTRAFRQYTKSAGRSISRAEWRRENVTSCVRKIYNAVKAVKPWVALSCSPVGKHDDLPRQFSYGWNARTAVSQDVQQWMREGIMDQIFPMMYFRGQHFYPFALDWIENSNGRTVVPGLGIYFLDPGQKDWPIEDITRELNFLRVHGAGGQAYFRAKFLEDNVKGLAGYLGQSFYAMPALQPAMTWIDSIKPTAPAGVRVEKKKYEWNVSWQPSVDETPGDRLRYNIYASEEYPVIPEKARLMAKYLPDCAYTVDMACPASRRLFYAVAAIDRFGNESAPAEINRPEPQTQPARDSIEVSEGKISLAHIDTKIITITDDLGRELMVRQYDTIVDVSRLAPGFYKIYGQNRKGKPHLEGRFRVRP